MGFAIGDWRFVIEKPMRNSQIGRPDQKRGIFGGFPRIRAISLKKR